MKYFIGIDGGGTKTDYLMTDDHGNVCAKAAAEGSSYLMIGIDGVADQFEQKVSQCLLDSGAARSQIAGITAGVPCLGENPEADRQLVAAVRARFSGMPLYICNDAEVGWAGSLGLASGINVVAGTGSIAFGKNGAGQSVRTGGWSTFFGDEGSCYWLGRKTVELFAKQFDGRVPKNKLYDIIMTKFDVTTPMDFIALAEKEYAPDRSKVASLQRYLLAAAVAGDASAVKLYDRAADELGMMAVAAAAKIRQPGERLGVTLSGGLSHAKQFVMKHFERWVDCFDGYMTEAAFSPVEGAVLLAADQFSKEDIEAIKHGLKYRENMEDEIKCL